MDEADPIETDDTFEAFIWHAEDKIRALKREMAGLRDRLKHCNNLLVQWQALHRNVSAARETRASILVVENGDEPDEPTRALKRIRDP